MNGFVSKISQLKENLAVLKENARKEGLKLFNDQSRFHTISYIESRLDLNDYMSVSDLEAAIRFIEHIKIGTNFNKAINFSQETPNRTLALLGVKEPLPQKLNQKEPRVLIPKNSPLSHTLERIHGVLINHYELARAHANGEIPVSQVHYDANLLRQTQMVHDIENTTKEETTHDNSTAVFDIRRGGTTFYGAKIIPGEEDCYICPTIEQFAGDKIKTLGSKANKIFNFGGQVLHAIILDEFENSMELIEDDRHLDGLKPMVTRGNINWSKNDETNEIYATVDLKILTISYTDPDDKSKLPEYFAIRSDGITLDRIDDENVLKLSKKATQDVSDVVPVCTFQAKLALTLDQRTGHHYLKVNEFTAKINTPDLISRKDPNQTELQARISINP